MRRITLIAGLLLGASVIAASAQDYDRSNQTSGNAQTYGQTYNDQTDQAQRDQYQQNGQFDQDQQRYYGGQQSAQNAYSPPEDNDRADRDRDNDRAIDRDRDNDRDRDADRDQADRNRDQDRDEAEATAPDRDRDADDRQTATRQPYALEQHQQPEATPGNDFYGDRDRDADRDSDSDTR